MADELSTEESTDEGAGGVQFGTQLNIVQGPDGKAWWSHTILLGPTNYTYGMPLDTNEPYFDNLAAHARSLIKEHKRKKAGIILPDDGTTVRTKTGIHLARGNHGRRH